MAEVLLDVKNLVTNFYTKRGVVHAVRDVSYQVHRGEMVGIVGESGSGKSVSAFSVLGLVKKPGRIESGQVIFKGTDLRTLSPQELLTYRGRYMSMIFQEPLSALNPAYTVGWQIAEAFRNNGMTDKKEIEERVMGALKIVGLSSKMKAKPSELSGGEQQRVSIARAIVNGPPLLIADEPTGNLDPNNSMEIMQILEQINSKGITVIVSTHDRAIVDHFRKRVITLDKGHIIRDMQAGTYA